MFMEDPWFGPFLGPARVSYPPYPIPYRTHSSPTDASVWLYQFIRAMRDEHGETVKNAHLVGFFRRLCKYDLEGGR